MERRFKNGLAPIGVAPTLAQNHVYNAEVRATSAEHVLLDAIGACPSKL